MIYDGQFAIRVSIPSTNPALHGVDDSLQAIASAEESYFALNPLLMLLLHS